MNQHFKKNTILVLDLDDTLYTEADYVLSGIKHIANLIKKTTRASIIDELLSFHQENPQSDFLEYACNIARVPLSAKETLLWSYRLHSPDIFLDKKTQNWLEKSKREYHALAILTDGRSITQRLKLESLGLIDLPIYISEEWDSIKPDKKRFLAIEERWEKKTYIYIGDNPKKDFAAPNHLGWISIGLKDKGRNTHTQNIDIPLNTPNYWINHLFEIELIIDIIK